MRILKITFVLLWLSTTLFSQSTNLITNIDNRQVQNLNGKWKIIIDPYENGFYNYRYEESPTGYFKNEKPKTPSDLIEYNFDASDELYVPSDWNSQMQELKWYEGTIWYKRSFDYKKTPGKRVFVYLGAVNYKAHVYLNGKKLGEHTGGFTPFNFEVTDLIKEKDNFLVIKADNKRAKDAVPTLNTDWWNYGGVTRDVKIVEVNTTFIQDTYIQLAKGSLNQISGWVKLNGDNKAKKIRVSIPEAKWSADVTTNDEGVAVISGDAKLSLWSPENPKLYQVLVIAGQDTLTDQIGFRCVETKDHDILLNKKSVLLKGVCIHEEVPTRGGRAYSMEDAQLLLGWAKSLGCNYVRLAHYPHNENMTRLADKMGLMVWSEIPVYWTIEWSNPLVLENAEKQLTEMVLRDKNKASVVIWSMANETPLSAARLTFLKNLIETTRQLDNTRLISAALEVHNSNKNTMMIDDPLGEYLDVLGCNEYIGWYGDRKPEECDSISWTTKYNKPLVISETGADAAYGFHGATDQRFTEEYQANYFQHQLLMLGRIDFLRGISPWVLADFRSPRRPLSNVQDFWNRKGLISEHGEKKKAFFVVKNFYENWKLK
ncbi:MAG: glycoside hydrolase family 2 protein [Flavobacteriales bacterium]